MLRSILETNTVVWNPHEDKYVLMLEQIQKRFLRFLYRSKFNYYPYLYPTLFLQGSLGYDSLQLRRSLGSYKFYIKLLHNKIDSSALLVLRLQTPRQAYGRPNACRRLFALPDIRSEHRRNSSLVRELHLLNLLASEANECDVFATGITQLVDACKRGTSIKY